MTDFWAKTPYRETPTWDNIHPVLDHLISDNSSGSFMSEAARLTLTAVNIGGFVACIVNTVDEAQKIFERIDAGLAPDIPRFLVHSRFMRKDRSAHETRLQKMFGRDGAERPERAVVVATQILEQSLDVDFDTMISDLAPIDLLIQRLGRVHHHLTERPSTRRPHTLPAITVLSPSADNFRPKVNVIHNSYIQGDLSGPNRAGPGPLP